LTEIYAFLFLEFVCKPVDDHMVEVVSAKMGVSIGRFHFKHAIAKFEN
jgi:hypothetical protein